MFDALAMMDEPPVALVYLTDLYGSFPSDDRGIPTLWATPNGQTAPFGTTLRIDD